MEGSSHSARFSVDQPTSNVPLRTVLRASCRDHFSPDRFETHHCYTDLVSHSSGDRAPYKIVGLTDFEQFSYAFLPYRQSDLMPHICTAGRGLRGTCQQPTSILSSQVIAAAIVMWMSAMYLHLWKVWFTCTSSCSVPQVVLSSYKFVIFASISMTLLLSLLVSVHVYSHCLSICW